VNPGHGRYILYVDDLLIVSPNLEPEEYVKKQLQGKYRMTELGEPRRVLGLNIKWNNKDGTVPLEQQDSIDTIVKRFNMMDANNTSNPLDPNVKLYNYKCKDKTINEDTYLLLVGHSCMLL
jgi:hypothetical protein